MSNFEQYSDEELLKNIQEGNHFAFAVLVRRYSGRFYRLAYRFTVNCENAEDVVQESFIKLWESPDIWNADRGVKFTTWFYKIIVNRCLDLQRKYKISAIDDDMQVEAGDPANDDVLIRQQEQRALENAIFALPVRQRTALNLCFYEGLSNQQAAEVMGLNLKALQSLIMRAKSALKEQMKTYA